MPAVFYLKDPNAKLDFSVEWEDWLASGETLSSVSWTVATGLTQSGSPAASNTTTRATVWLEGGTAGQDYDVTCRATTSAGRIDDRTLRIQVRQR